MGWAYLVAGMVLGIVCNYYAKLANGFEHVPYALISFGLGTASFMLWILAIKTLPLATSYVTWTAAEITAMTLMAVMLFGEAMPPIKLFFIVLVIVGVLGLIVVSKSN